MGNLEELINELTSSIDNPSSEDIFSKVKDKKGLLTALTDLNNQIGNDNIKEEIAIETLMIVQKPTDKNMKNILLFGGPGRGKTTIARIIGRIIAAVGHLQSREKKIIKEVKTSKETMEDANYIIIILMILYFIFLVFYPIMSNMISSPIILMIIFGVLFIFLLWCFPNSKQSVKPKDIAEYDATVQCDSSDKFVIATRGDLVGRYVGETDKKTTAFLESCRGKVVLFDEAYALYNKPQDTFGIEALTVLNEFMSNNAGEIVIIFSGYEKELNETVFEAQPGLRRRFMWHLEVKDYTASQLTEIFSIQLAKHELFIQKGIEKSIIGLINQNPRKFINQGGDTERLAYFTYTTRNFAVMKKQKNIDEPIGISEIKTALDKMTEAAVREVNKHDDSYTQLLKALIK